MFRRHIPIKIEVDPLAVSSKSTHVAVRLDRIAENYRQLDVLLADVESRMPSFELAAGPLGGTPEGNLSESFRPQKPR